eukprot:CAMPEP_0171326016 /NCGR_PEP_ID=MMETSP0816-20121228/117179_1 /TAXON_ID=420281 /ORGANISM="Proboscia inermis, Strain CCAP1064/1" /LENGTH=67 /DNA_ID=CAMNT_0011825351 /DNA_START=872 /DNA_END=1075 /DNA_ORIENTATION=+
MTKFSAQQSTDILISLEEMGIDVLTPETSSERQMAASLHELPVFMLFDEPDLCRTILEMHVVTFQFT